MTLKRNIVLTTIAVLVLLVLITIFYACDNTASTRQTSGDSGKTLANQYCSRCHIAPGPEMLDKETWTKHVLPAMAIRMVIQVYGEDMYVNNASAGAMIPYEDWLKIVAYYKAMAPVVLKPATVSLKPQKDWAGFKLRLPLDSNKTVATTTMVSIDTIGNKIYTSDMLGANLYQWNNNLKINSVKHLPSAVVDARFVKDSNGNEQGIFTSIGSMKAIDVLNGMVINVDLKNKLDIKDNELVDSLPRPVQTLPVDIDKDGLTDLLVCGFGHNQGGLYWFRQLKNKQYVKNTISNMPGALHAVIGDYNHDGWPDIMCLFAQGEEGIWMFLNDHKGGFKTVNLLRFPPVYGSSSFQLADFNNDGQPDILYTAGDNSDYSKILKPYHGVYIFLNQGNFKFKQAYFYPINGATKAVAADFNGDKKLGIAVIAFFSDLKNNPGEGFTYFEQDKPMHFIPHNLPIAKQGRWICMDVNDYNHDGRQDIILGNYSLGFINEDGLKANWNVHNPFVILENIGGKK
jgi:hypothetical protein